MSEPETPYPKPNELKEAHPKGIASPQSRKIVLDSNRLVNIIADQNVLAKHAGEKHHREGSLAKLLLLTYGSHISLCSLRRG
jgi:hypothetical protein